MSSLSLSLQTAIIVPSYTVIEVIDYTRKNAHGDPLSYRVALDQPIAGTDDEIAAALADRLDGRSFESLGEHAIDDVLMVAIN